MVGGRQSSATGWLVRLGFDDARSAARLITSTELTGLIQPESDDSGLMRALAHTADPDLALRSIVRLLESADGRGPIGGTCADLPDLRSVLDHHSLERDRLLAVLGASSALGDHLVRHPQHWRRAAYAAQRSGTWRRDDLVSAVSPSRRGALSGADALRIGYRGQLLEIAALDVVTDDPTDILPATAAALADLAGAALEAGLAIAREEVGPDAERTRLAVIGMGKCGGRELNYVSDVDVVFAAEPADGVTEGEALSVAAKLATAMMRACSASTAEGTLWPVDAALRPEGKQGPLVRTVRSHVAYYKRWAKTWEFQALLKARCVAGDADVGAAYDEQVGPFVWEAAGREHFVEDVQAMRRRVEDHVPAGEAARQIKLGAGGLRDVEFAVQLLQLVHGRFDDTLRSSTTLDALDALARGGYVAREDAAAFDVAYRTLRTLEHRVQLYRMRRTHLIPTSDIDLRRLGRSLGLRRDPSAELMERWRDLRREVRRIHERLFYRPLLSATANLPSGHGRLSPEAARTRLAALGFRDPSGALRHLESLTSGTNRAAAIQRTLLPLMLEWFADEVEPDAGLLAFRKLSESLGGTHWYLKMLRDEGRAAERLAHVLARSRYTTDLLMSAPESVRMLADQEELLPRSREQVLQTMRSAITRKDDADDAISAVRVIRRHELFRIALADLVDILDDGGVQIALTDLNEALLESALYIAKKKVGIERGAAVCADIALIGMGRLGGGECGYGSDADIVVIHRPSEVACDTETARVTETTESARVTEATESARVTEATEAAQAAEVTEVVSAVVLELRRLVGMPGPDPAFPVDIDLRPEGKAGPLSRTLEGYAAYYRRWSGTWEAQALLRARPVAGDVELGRRFIELIDPVRWPATGLDATQIKEIRRLKARMESERLPRGADPKTHVKLGRGGLSDVEWTAQLLQMQHAHTVPGLRTTRTLAALDAAAQADLIGAVDARTLAESWQFASALRNAMVLFRVRGSESVPSDIRDCEAASRIMGDAPGSGAMLGEKYLRVARRARQVTERVFYGRAG